MKNHHLNSIKSSFNLFFNILKGNFLRVRTANGAFSETYFFTQSIKVTEPGDYILSFYNFFNCNSATCNTANDTMAVRIREGTTGFYKEVYLGGTKYGRLRDDRWIKEEVQVKLNASNYYVNFLFNNFK